MGRRMVIGEIDVTNVVVGDICKKSALQIQRQGVSRVATSVKAKVILQGVVPTFLEMYVISVEPWVITDWIVP